MKVRELADDCLFCSIVAGEAEASVVARDEYAIAFHDIHPRAPVHVLVTPRRHIDSAHDLDEEDDALLGACFRMARQVAEQEGVAEGYRVATNIGSTGGQAIPHLHFHVLGGRQLGHIDSGEPPV